MDEASGWKGVLPLLTLETVESVNPDALDEVLIVEGRARKSGAPVALALSTSAAQSLLMWLSIWREGKPAPAAPRQ